MRTTALIGMLALFAACAGTREVPEDIQAVRDYIEVGELAQVDKIRTQGNDRWIALVPYFALYEARDGFFLLEFNRRCREMFDNSSITPDRRYDYNMMRRGVDTLRGCRIDRMYPLSDAQADEIRALVENKGG
jgi:hypothetical protein